MVSCRSQNGGNLSRVMAVVVDNEDAVPLTADVKPTVRTLKRGKSSGDAIEREVQLQADGHRRESVSQIVDTRHMQL
jgi:hypothetical protein